MLDNFPKYNGITVKYAAELFDRSFSQFLVVGYSVFAQLLIHHLELNIAVGMRTHMAVEGHAHKVFYTIDFGTIAER